MEDVTGDNNSILHTRQQYYNRMHMQLPRMSCKL